MWTFCAVLPISEDGYLCGLPFGWGDWLAINGGREQVGVCVGLWGIDTRHLFWEGGPGIRLWVWTGLFWSQSIG